MLKHTAGIAWCCRTPGAGAEIPFTLSPDVRSGAHTRVTRPMESHDSTRLAANEIAGDSFWMKVSRVERPSRRPVAAAEASKRESMSFETQHRFVTAQAAHQLVQAIHCPRHSDFLPIASTVLR
jgi:hypothetical protein